MASRIFLHIILASQLFAILVGWFYFGLITRLATEISALHIALLIFSALVVLCGVAGSILVWAGKKLGYTLSIAHQLLIAFVIYMPLNSIINELAGAPANFIPPNTVFYGIHDAFTSILFIVADGSSAAFHLKITFGQLVVVSAIMDNSQRGFIGINILALIFARVIAKAKTRKFMQPKAIAETFA